MVPSGNTAPEAVPHTTGTGPLTASAAVATYSTTAPAAEVASTVRSCTEIDGGIVSATVTVAVVVDPFPRLSEAEHPTSVVPRG